MMSTVTDNPNETSMQLTGRDYISHSSISTYQRCPLKYYFRYVKNIPERFVSSALVFGSAIHQALQFHFEELLAGNEAPDLDTLLSVYQDEWRNRDKDTVRFGKTESISSLGQLAERMLSAFQQSELSRPDERILGIEEEFREPLIEEVPDLLARIDLISETDEKLIVTDFKTSRSRWSEAQARQSGDQLLLYGEIVKEIFPEKEIALRFVVLTKTKNPVIEQIDVPFGERQASRAKNIVNRVWNAIRTHHFYPNPSAMNCAGCPFQVECRDWTGKE